MKHDNETYTANPQRYDNTTYNKCTNSGLMLPRISLGLWHNFGDIDNKNEANQMLHYAFDNGITHFDLANNYGVPAGSAEKNFGKAMKHDFKSYRDELIISTKAGHMMWPGPYGDGGSRKYLMASIDQSLERMKLDYVDIFYSHRYDENTPIEETMQALADIVKQGKALYVGISKYPAEKAKQAYALLAKMGTPCVLYQGRYSIFTREAETEVFPVADEAGVGFIAFSPLAQGLLTDKYLQNIPENSRAAQAHGFLKSDAITPEVRERITKLNDIALERGQSLAQMALAWCFHKPQVHSVIIGASSVAQLANNIKALDNTHFSNEELWRIGEI
jgi:L-glyceraldehyde 3-phosphate reductase